jgi:pyruvyltransferase
MRKKVLASALLSIFTSLALPLGSLEQEVSPADQIYRQQAALYFEKGSPLVGVTNFEDRLSKKIVERIVDHKILTTSAPYLQQKKLLAVGSILHVANDNDVVWGSGIDGENQNLEKLRVLQLDVRAVRGPLTRKTLMQRGIDCPEVYGDPTLLFPRLFPEFKKNEHPSKDYVVIPNYSDEHLFSHLPQMVSTTENWQKVINTILDSKFVISSSLAGIMIAEAYGIPARLLRINKEGNSDDLIKFADYYYGTNRFDFHYAKSVEEALKMKGEPMPKGNLEQLLHVFPFDLFFSDECP